MNNPLCQAYPNLPFENLIPAVDSIHYDGWTLRVKLLFEPLDYELVYLDFNSVIGFRMLDEGDLLEFWNDNRPDSWLLSVLERGWYDQEKLREGFTTQYISEKDKKKPNEFLLTTENECLSILTNFEPKITAYEP